MNYLRYAILFFSLSVLAGYPDQNATNTSVGSLKNNNYTIDFAIGGVSVNSIGVYVLAFCSRFNKKGRQLSKIGRLT